MKKNKRRGCEEQPLSSMESKFPELKMSRIKSIIQKLFPPEQKTLNIFKVAYLVLFVISLPEIFVYVGGGSGIGDLECSCLVCFMGCFYSFYACFANVL